VKIFLSTIFIFLNCLCFAGSVIEAITAGDWSEPTNGLRGRLLFSEDAKFYGTEMATVYLELQNVANIGNPMEIYFDTIHSPLHFELKNVSGNSQKNAPADLDEMIPGSYWIDLPHDSTLRFRVSSNGYGIPKDAGLAIGVPGNFWIIPYAETNDYFLTASFDVIPAIDKDHIHAWKGTLKLSPVKIPAKRP
jgi:hypothetical protein